MNQILTIQNQIAQSTQAWVRLALPHGYRFDGDIVHLHARFTVQDPAAHQVKWLLQLWACPTQPATVDDIREQLVAEITLPPMSEIADEEEHLTAEAFAIPPAGCGTHAMVMAVTAVQAGQPNKIHDFAVYPRRESFGQPTLEGNVRYHVDQSRVQITVERIKNPRGLDNRSGTLALELWALPAPYTGGTFEGNPIAKKCRVFRPNSLPTSSRSDRLPNWKICAG